MRFKIAIASLFFLIPLAVSAGSGVGFVQGAIWYSKDPFFAGEPVRVYSAVLNTTSEDIVGSVAFSDNGALIGSAEFSAAGGNRLQEVWVDWQPTEGQHSVSAKIVKALVSKAGKPAASAAILGSESGASERFVDIDTDHDGVGNVQDADDDNDGVSDADEHTQGTNPLVADAKRVTGVAAAFSGSSGTFTAQAVDASKKVAAEAKDTVDTFAQKLDASLAVTEQNLANEVAALKQKESSRKQTPELEKLNEAVGGGQNSTSSLITKPAGTLSDTVMRLLKQLLLYLVKIARWVLRTPIALYVVVGLAVLYIVRFAWRMMRRRQYQHAA